MFCKIHLIYFEGRERNLIFFHRRDDVNPNVSRRRNLCLRAALSFGEVAGAKDWIPPRHGFPDSAMVHKERQPSHRAKIRRLCLHLRSRKCRHKRGFHSGRSAGKAISRCVSEYIALPLYDAPPVGRSVGRSVRPSARLIDTVNWAWWVCGGSHVTRRILHDRKLHRACMRARQLRDSGP